MDAKQRGLHGFRASPDPTATQSGKSTVAERLRLYSMDDVRAVLGQRKCVPPTPMEDVWDGGSECACETEHQARLGAIIADGSDGEYRDLLGPCDGFEETISSLAERAPHLSEVCETAVQWMLAARQMGLPAAMTPLLLRGPAGVGKTWLLGRLGAALGVPFRRYPMSGSSLADGLHGSHPVWRNAGPGLVAKTLLTEPTANPLIFVDEFDKVSRSADNAEPYRPFYSLLDPSDSAAFVDEYLQFAVDASHVLWVLAANEIDDIPAPILDRLHIIDVPEMDAAQLRRVAISIYEEANQARRTYFEDAPSAVLDRLAVMTPRSMRKATEAAMTRAAAAGRRSILFSDLRETSRIDRRRWGFLS